MAAYTGIYNDNPYATPNAMEIALRTAGGIGALGQQYQQTKQAALQNYLAQQTMPGIIGATNQENASKMQYGPQLAALGLQKEQAGLDELRQRTQLYPQEMQSQIALREAQRQHYLNQIQQMNQKTNPLSEFDEIYRQYQAAEPGSPQQMMLEGMLNKMMGAAAGAGVPSLGAPSKSTSPTGNMSLIPGGANNLTVNPLKGGQRSAQQGFITNPDGTVTSVEAPTTNSMSFAQTRKAAEAEANVLSPVVQKGLSHYAGPGANFKLMTDAAVYKMAPDSERGKAAGKRLYEYEIATRFMNENAAINARQATGGNPGIEQIREFKEGMYPAIPNVFGNYFIPSDIRQQGLMNYQPIQQQAVKAAIDQERLGFQEEHPGLPEFMQSPQITGGYFSGGQFIPKTTVEPQKSTKNENKKESDPLGIR